MTPIELGFYSIVTLIVSIFSGATGGGGGFILTPLMIFLGLSPAQAIASGKFGGISVTVGSLLGLREHKVNRHKLQIILMGMAIIIGLVAPNIITSIDSSSYQKILGLLILLTSPLIVIKRVGAYRKNISRLRQAAGLALVAVSMFLVAIFSGGIGIFINISMMSFLGLNALDASVIKRSSQIFLNTIIILGLLGSGLFVWNVIVVTMITTVIGGYIGGRIATLKGNSFVNKLIAGVAALSGLALLLG